MAAVYLDTDNVKYVSWENGQMVLTDEDENVSKNNTAQPNNWLAQLPMPNQHIEWAIVIGTIAFLAFYLTGHMDLALFTFGILIGGTFADLYIHNYQH